MKKLVCLTEMTMDCLSASSLVPTLVDAMAKKME